MGYTNHTCTVCGHSYQDSFVKAKGHDYREEEIPATCTNYGFTQKTCATCGHSFLCSPTAPLGHALELQNAKEASCTQEGYSGDQVCTRCGLVLETGMVIPVDRTHCPSRNFVDVDPSRWYHAGIDFAVSQGLMVGTTATQFRPDNSLTRGQIVTILYRLAGSPAAAGKTPSPTSPRDGTTLPQ